MRRALLAVTLLLVATVHADAPQLSEASALKVENHLLKVKLWQNVAQALEQEKQALVKEEAILEQGLRAELKADAADRFDWTTRQFVKPAKPGE
jgi:hypothetical protein